MSTTHYLTAIMIVFCVVGIFRRRCCCICVYRCTLHARLTYLLFINANINDNSFFLSPFCQYTINILEVWLAFSIFFDSITHSWILFKFQSFAMKRNAFVCDFSTKKIKEDFVWWFPSIFATWWAFRIIEFCSISFSHSKRWFTRAQFSCRVSVEIETLRLYWVVGKLNGSY